MDLTNMTIPRNYLDKGLYEVTIEKITETFDPRNHDWVLQNNIDTEYVFVNDFENFDKWIKNKSKEQSVNSVTTNIRYKKIAETMLVVN